MTLPSIAPYSVTGLGSYDRHIPALMALVESLPNPLPYATYPGGFVLKLSEDHFVAVLLPPVPAAEHNLMDYLGAHFDGTWEVPSIEYFGQVEAWHLTPPWADHPEG